MDVLCSKLIRPKRFVYSLFDLGPLSFRLHGVVCRREDFYVENQRGLRVACSWFFPLHNSPLPCLVFCHGNCGCRLDSIEVAKALLPLGISVLSFDFSGSGLSEGDYVSLGFYEKEDIRAVVAYARSMRSVKSVSLWGRSMGAVAALLYAAEDPKLAMIVLDSPFSSLTELIKEQIQKVVWVPSSFSLSLLKKVKKRILNSAKFDIDCVSPLRVIAKCVVPCVFIHSKDDVLISSEHSLKLFALYPHLWKQIYSAEGGHNALRPVCLIEMCGRSIHKFSGTAPFVSPLRSSLSTQRSFRSQNIARRTKVFQSIKTYSESLQTLGTYRLDEPSDVNKSAIAGEK